MNGFKSVRGQSNSFSSFMAHKTLLNWQPKGTRHQIKKEVEKRNQLDKTIQLILEFHH